MGVREGFLEERTSELVLGYLEIIQAKGDTMAKRHSRGTNKALEVGEREVNLENAESIGAGL